MRGPFKIDMEREYPTYLSRRLYQYLCDTIGSEKVVKMRRLYYGVIDYFLEGDNTTHISSGSMGEGLNMAGSDVDIMEVLKFISVTDEKTTDAMPVEMFIMETEDTKAGYTHLRMNKCGENRRENIFDYLIYQWCTMKGDNLYISSKIFKEWHLEFELEGSFVRRYIHGPCITDENDEMDCAFCLKCEEWVEQAQPWIMRSRHWPSSEIISLITSYGVLFVPIGCKGSPNESIEWRISFSFAEKHLIYSFSHTQLLCYALLKILLKEIIDKHTILKGLLCSYFLKTTLFWVSEELPASVWIPENFFNCFSECYKRLIYSITYRNLPHYFIVENNLFENRFDESQYSCLLDFLSQRYDRRMFGLAESQTLSRYFSDPVYVFEHITIENNISAVFDSINNFQRIPYCSHAANLNGETLLCRRLMLKLNHFVSWRLFYKYCHIYAKSSLAESDDHNKNNYNKIKDHFPFLILGTNTDAACGWLTVASYYYCRKQFNTSLEIIHRVLERCSPDKVYSKDENISLEHLDITEKRKLQNNQIRVDGIFKRHMIDIVILKYSTLVPKELKTKCNTTETFCSLPVVYAYFLRFLCWFNLHDEDQCIHAIHALGRTFNNRYFIRYKDSLGNCLTCLGIAYSMIGGTADAQWCFKMSKRCCPLASVGLTNTI